MKGSEILKLNTNRNEIKVHHACAIPAPKEGGAKGKNKFRDRKVSRHPRFVDSTIIAQFLFL